MKNRINQLAKGIIESETPKLTFSTDSLHGTLLSGKKLSVDITLVSENQIPMKAFLYCTHPRVTVAQPFAVGKIARTTLEVNTDGCTAGETIQGKVDAVYNGGELSLPFSFVIGAKKGKEEVQNFQTADEFFQYTKGNFDQAVELFASKEFLRFPFMQTLEYQGLYYTYAEGKNPDRALVNFMNSLGYKSRILSKALAERLPESALTVEKKTTTAGGKKSKKKEVSQNPKRYIALMLELWMSYERFRKGNRQNPEQDFAQAFADCQKIYGASTLVQLVCAYYYMREGQFDTAKKILDAVTEEVQHHRVERKGEYCLLLYVGSKISEDESRLAMTQKLVHKYFTEGYNLIITILEYRLNPDCNGSIERQEKFLRDCFRKEIKSSALYQEACFLWQKSMDNVNSLNTYELQVLHFGLRHGLISEKMLFDFLRFDVISAKNLNLFLLVLREGYHKFQNTDLLEAICSLYLQSGKSGKDYYWWYREAVEKKIVIHGLYEYYLASTPKDFTGPLPREVVLHFGRSGEPSEAKQPFLYANVLREYPEDEEIQELYDTKLKQFALRRMLQEVYNDQMIPLYKKILSQDLVREEYSAGFISLLHLYRITTHIPNAVRIIVHYPQLKQEAAYRIENGVAFVHLFSDKAILAVEDGQGERYYDAKMNKVRLFDNPSLESKCQPYQTGTLMMQLQRSDKILKGTIDNDQEVHHVIDMINNRSVGNYYRNLLYEKLIDYTAENEESQVDATSFLMEVNQTGFAPEYQVKLVQILIRKELYEVAYERILRYGYDHLSTDDLLMLVRHMLQHPIVKTGKEMEKICYYLLEHCRCSNDILGYLAEKFNGTTEQMYALLQILRNQSIPATDLTERTLAQCFFTGKEEHLDQLFTWYCQGESQDRLVVQAYLVLRCHQYFMGQYSIQPWQMKQVSSQVERMPEIAMLALLTYYSQKELDEDELVQAKALVEEAVSRNLILGCFAELGTKIALPGELEGCAFIEYRNLDAESVTLAGMIQPGNTWYQRSMFPVYSGVFGRAVLLYNSECFNYRFKVQTQEGQRLEVAGDTVGPQYVGGMAQTRYADMNHLEEVVSKGSKADMADCMRQLLLKDAMIQNIFGQKRS